MPQPPTALDGPVTIRAAAERDLDAIRAIYNHWVVNSVATFDMSEQAAAERASWFSQHASENLPVLVAEVKGRVVGWGSLSYYHSRCAYKQTVEPSVYVHPDFIYAGIGKSLVDALMIAAKENGYHTVVALICSENINSIRLFAGFGFTEIGTLKEVGRKFDRWLDVTLMQKALQ
jgi:L-amino acid N-acyltransferase